LHESNQFNGVQSGTKVLSSWLPESLLSPNIFPKFDTKITNK